MANYYVIRIKFHWGFSYMTHYMKHSLLGTRRVISSIITPNFFVTRNKEPMTIGTNWMCISRDDNCANTMCFPWQLLTTARKLFATICFLAFFDVCDTSCPIDKLPFSFLLCDKFLKTYFLSMPQFSKYVSIRPNERFRKVLQSWRSRYLVPTESPCCNFATPCEEDTNEALWGPFGERKARYGKYWVPFGDNKARWRMK